MDPTSSNVLSSAAEPGDRANRLSESEASLPLGPLGLGSNVVKAWVAPNATRRPVLNLPRAVVNRTSTPAVLHHEVGGVAHVKRHHAVIGVFPQVDGDGHPALQAHVTPYAHVIE